MCMYQRSTPYLKGVWSDITDSLHNDQELTCEKTRRKRWKVLLLFSSHFVLLKRASSKPQHQVWPVPSSILKGENARLTDVPLAWGEVRNIIINSLDQPKVQVFNYVVPWVNESSTIRSETLPTDKGCGQTKVDTWRDLFKGDYNIRRFS